VLALTVVGAACDDDEDGGEGGAIAITLSEFNIEADPAEAAAGSVTFDVTNEGGEAHEFMVIKTDLDPAELPVMDDGSVDEAQVEVVDEIEEDELQAGDSASLTVDLEAGSYALICNLVEEEEGGEHESHYAEGMHTAFTVTE
jgi:uncharacterized cupredoxin-like copper-binding protein